MCFPQLGERILKKLVELLDPIITPKMTGINHIIWDV